MPATTGMPRLRAIVSTVLISTTSRLDATINGIDRPRECICSISSTPSITGISRSMMATSGGSTSSDSSSSASAPLPAS